MDIKTLSKKLKLSITTVSRALGGYSDVSEKTRLKVKKLAKKLMIFGYTHKDVMEKVKILKNLKMILFQKKKFY